MRDRLIELFKKTEYTPFPEMTMTANLGNQFTDYGLNCIVDSLLANGVIVPPCDIGQTVYCVDNYLEVVEECKVYGFNVVNGKLSLLVDNGENKFITRKWHNTKEEAEEKLKEMSNNVNL